MPRAGVVFPGVLPEGRGVLLSRESRGALSCFFEVAAVESGVMVVTSGRIEVFGPLVGLR